jgi:hypothetical protein
MAGEQLPHDAFLQDLRVDWEPGTAALRFVIEEKTITVKVRGLRLIKIPREQPWGPSIWVNQTSGPVQAGGDMVKFLIEMQSGDQIEIVGENVAIDSSPRSV